MASESVIVSALQKGVVAAVAQCDIPALPVKYLLKDITIPQDQKWIETVWLPNNRSDFLGDEKNHRGILRLVLHWPNKPTAVYGPLDLLDSITRYFTKGVLLSNAVQVYDISPTGIIEDGDDYLFPVSIFYQSYQGA